MYEREKKKISSASRSYLSTVLQNVQDYEQGPVRQKVKLIWIEKVNETTTKKLFFLLLGAKNNGEKDPEAKGHFCDTWLCILLVDLVSLTKARSSINQQFFGLKYLIF